MKEKVKWIHVKILTAFSLWFIYSLSLWLIDYGASLRCYNLCHINTFILQGLLLDMIEPRIAYHLGLVLSFFSFILFVLLYIVEVLKEKGGES